jgi:transcriptional regulator with XRE-family HTH domain
MENKKDILAKLDQSSYRDDTWKEHVSWREENSDWLKKSSRIAVKILRILRAKKMTQKDLAIALQVSPQMVSKLLSGEVNLELKTICKIEGILDTEIVTIAIKPPKVRAYHMEKAYVGRIIKLTHFVAVTCSEDYELYPAADRPTINNRIELVAQ